MGKSKKNTSLAKTQRPRRDKDFLRLPKYPGGNDALRRFIDANIQYPEQARESGVEGEVHVKYDVAETGDVIEVQILRGIGSGCDEEAERVIRLLKFTPVRNRGQRVTSHFELILYFRDPLKVSFNRGGNRMQENAFPGVYYTYVPQDVPEMTERAEENHQATSQQTSHPLQSSGPAIVYTWTGR